MRDALDPRRIAPCLPGASLESVAGDDRLGLSPVTRRRLVAGLILADVFVPGWAIGRLGGRRWRLSGGP